MNEKIAIISKIDLKNIDITNIKINIPSSKSYLNRALILSSIQGGQTILTDVFKICDDVSDMIRVLQEIGIFIEAKENKNGSIDIIIDGNGGKFIQPISKIINCGLGGTTTRFLLGISSLFDFDVEITACGKMLERPVREMFEFLTKIGKKVIFLEKENYLPVIIKNIQSNNISKISIDGNRSSQFLSSVLMVSNKLNIKEIEVNNLVSKSYINITLDLLKIFGIHFKQYHYNGKIQYIISKTEKQSNRNSIVKIEQDYSAVSYFLALQYLFNFTNDIVKIEKSSQGDAKFVKIIEKIDNFKHQKSNNKLLILNMRNMPDVSMTAMIICSLQNFKTRIIGLKTLAIKECDRLKAMQNELKKVGVITKVSKKFDAITIYGKGEFELKDSIEIDTYNDHRIAMCFAVLGTKIGNIKIKNASVVNKSFPNFWQELEKFNCVKVI